MIYEEKIFTPPSPITNEEEGDDLEETKETESEEEEEI